MNVCSDYGADLLLLDVAALRCTISTSTAVHHWTHRCPWLLVVSSRLDDRSLVEGAMFGLLRNN